MNMLNWIALYVSLVADEYTDVDTALDIVSPRKTITPRSKLTEDKVLSILKHTVSRTNMKVIHLIHLLYSEGRVHRGSSENNKKADRGILHTQLARKYFITFAVGDVIICKREPRKGIIIQIKGRVAYADSDIIVMENRNRRFVIKFSDMVDGTMKIKKPPSN